MIFPIPSRRRARELLIDLPGSFFRAMAVELILAVEDKAILVVEEQAILVVKEQAILCVHALGCLA